MIAYTGIYFFFFAFLGIYCSCFSGHLHDLGFTGHQIASIFSIVPAFSLVFNLIWGRVSDRYQIRKALSCLLPIIGSLSITICLLINTYSAYLTLAILMGIFVNPLMSLTDSLTISFCKDKNKNYGSLRQWGTMSFCLINILIIPTQNITQWLGSPFIINNYSILFSMPFLLTICGFSAFFVRESKWEGQHISIKESLQILKSPSLLLFIFSAMLHNMSFVSSYVYFTPFLKNAGYSLAFIGLCWAVSPIFEIFVFRYSQWVLQYFSLKFLFQFSLFSCVIRWGLLAFYTDPIIVFLTQFLHTFGFGTYFLVAIQLLMQNIPEKIRSSGQGFFSAFSNALGLIISNIILGFVLQKYAYQGVYLTATLFSVLAVFITFLIPTSFWKKI